MKKILAILLALITAFSLVGCGDKNQNGNQVNPDDNPGTDVDINDILPSEVDYDGIPVAPKYRKISDEGYKTYYFSSDGNDGNNGLSKESPKKSLQTAASIIKNVKANAPVKVLFKAGSVYENDELVLDKFEATEEKPLIVSVYDTTETDKYVKIIGRDWANCISLHRGNIRLSGFELTAPKGYRGIEVTTNQKGPCKNIVISNNWCHDINFDLDGRTIPSEGTFGRSESAKISPYYSYDKGGIIFEVYNDKSKGPAWYENVWIENNLIERVSRCGVWVFSHWVRRPGIDWGNNPYYDDDTNWFHHTNINILGNTINYSGGDGVILGATVNGFMERNICRHAHFLNIASACAGLWVHSCKDTVMQFNEASYTHTRYDGQGFDIDIGCSNILFQYNYAHHNDGGGLLCCNTKREMPKYDKDGNYVTDKDGIPIKEWIIAPWHDVAIRNNVFADNRVADLCLSGTVNDVEFNNNTVIRSGTGDTDSYDVDIILTKDFSVGVPGDRWKFTNNIFYLKNKDAKSNFSMNFSTRNEETSELGYLFYNNLYYGFSDQFMQSVLDDKGLVQEKNALEFDPSFGDLTAKDGLENIKSFIPGNQQIMTSGKPCKKMLKYDFNGNDSENKFYIGAFSEIFS